MTAIAIIPARGGSKRIPRKNIRDFSGKPIIAYSILAAKSTGLFDEVMVSTDDEEIASVARSYGAEVPFLRTAKNADDYATTVDVLAEVLTEYRERFGKTFDWGCCIYPTAPFVQAEHLRAGYDRITTEKRDTVFPVVAFGYPVWRGFEIPDSDNTVKMLWPEYQASRSQDLKKVYHDAGQWYWFSGNTVMEKRKLFTDNSAAIILDEMDVQDIDTHTDWQLAEVKYKIRFDKA